MSTAFIRNKKLGRGINIANALEAPREGDWDLYYFIKIWTNGFGNVRYPFGEFSHSLQDFPFTIDVVFFKRTDTILIILNNLNIYGIKKGVQS